MSRAQIAEALIAKIIEERDILSAVEAGVRAEWFPEHAEPVWTWLAQYWQENRVVPTMAAFRRQWGSLAMPDVADEPLPGLIREFRTARKAMIVIESLEEARKQISIIDDDDERSNHILKLYADALSTVAHETPVTQASYLHDFVGPAAARALYGSSAKLGVPTGFPGIDAVLLGLRPEQFIVIGAVQKSFKSTLLLRIAMNVMPEGKVLFLGFEMSNEEQQDRMVSLGAGVSYTRVEQSSLLDDERKSVEQWEYDMLDLADNFVMVTDISSSTTASGVNAQIEQHQPIAVFIDGLYLMDDERGGPKGEQLSLRHVSQDIKRLAQRHRIPIVGTTQALSSKMTRKGGVTVDSLGFTSAWSQDADVVFGINRNEDVETEVVLKVLASRRSAKTEIRMIVDYSRGMVEEIVAGDLFRRSLHLVKKDDDDDI